MSEFVTIALARLDTDTLAAIDELARAKSITRHDSARILLRLGVEVLKRRDRAQQQPLTARGAR